MTKSYLQDILVFKQSTQLITKSYNQYIIKQGKTEKNLLHLILLQFSRSHVWQAVRQANLVNRIDRIRPRLSDAVNRGRQGCRRGCRGRTERTRPRYDRGPGEDEGRFVLTGLWGANRQRLVRHVFVLLRVVV